MERRILVIDSDATHASELQRALESISCNVTVCGDSTRAFGMIGRHHPDLVVVVPRSPMELADALASVRSVVRHSERRPEFLFVLRWTSRGPAERLLGDRWNVQVIYER
jgi:DNA-binding response OmpR family regulator